MIALIIVGVLLLCVIIALLLPISFYFKYDNDFYFKVKIAGIKVYEIEPEQDSQNLNLTDVESDKEVEKQEKSFFKKLKDKNGFIGAVKEIAKFVQDLLRTLGDNVKYITVKNLLVNITVASNNAAKTAIEYGALCTAVYPVLSLINSVLNVKMKKININSDFNGSKSEFDVACIVKLRIIFALKIFKTALAEYNKFKTRNEL